MQKDLYLIRGVPGGGKTTFVESLIRDGDVMVANDDFMVNKDGEYVFDWRKLDTVNERSLEAVNAAMKKSVSRIFVHNTFTKETWMQPFKDLADTHGYRCFSVIVENRHRGKSLHEVPEETIKKYKNDFDIKL